MVEWLINIENKVDILSERIFKLKGELEEIRKICELFSNQMNLQSANKLFIIVRISWIFNFIIYLYYLFSNYFKILIKFRMSWERFWNY